MKTIANNAPVVGVTFHQEGMDQLTEYADQAILKLVPEPENEYDKNALAVYAHVDGVGDFQVGYLSKKLAKSIHQNFDVSKVVIDASRAFEFEGKITGLRVKVLLLEEGDEYPTHVSKVG